MRLHNTEHRKQWHAGYIYLLYTHMCIWKLHAAKQMWYCSKAPGAAQASSWPIRRQQAVWDEGLKEFRSNISFYIIYILSDFFGVIPPKLLQYRLTIKYKAASITLHAPLSYVLNSYSQLFPVVPKSRSCYI